MKNQKTHQQNFKNKKEDKQNTTNQFYFFEVKKFTCKK